VKLKVYAWFGFAVSKRKVKGSLHLSIFEIIFVLFETKVNEIYILVVLISIFPLLMH